MPAKLKYIQVRHKHSKAKITNGIKNHPRHCYRIIVIASQPVSSPWLSLQAWLTPVIVHAPLSCHGSEKRQAVKTFQTLVPDMEHHY